MEQEYFIPAGDPGFLYDPVEPSILDITPPAPFNATGQHFVSVQVQTKGYWAW